ncbi:hypothetical protein [Xanthomonas sp. MUS 060]|nr:hypothetical protein [Xanthomonas sp. MUS 060]
MPSALPSLADAGLNRHGDIRCGIALGYVDIVILADRAAPTTSRV